MTDPDLRWIPSVDAVLRQIGPQGLPRPLAVAVIRHVLKKLRGRPSDAGPLPADQVFALAESAIRTLRQQRIETVINGTGVILHTNLGRAPMANDVGRAVAEAATRYCTLEYDRTTGERGLRGAYVEQSLAVFCHAEAATLVNNCAAALVLILRTFAARPPRTHVVISRGELVQIGGGFRVPDILEASGATLREVGTTNQTTRDDYRNAVDDRTAMILKVHQSNFYQGGFVAAPTTAELAGVAHDAGVPLVEDLGSGATFDTATLSPDTPHEPTPADVMAAGADLVCFSGDKLLGGPQAGVIAGRAASIAALKREPFFRALRCDKMVLVAMQTTTDHLLDDRGEALPAYAMLHQPAAAMRPRAEEIVAALSGVVGLRVRVGSGKSRVGGGALPRTEMASVTLQIVAAPLPPQQLAARLRDATPPLIGYVADGHFTLDLRTIFPDQDALVIAHLRNMATP